MQELVLSKEQAGVVAQINSIVESLTGSHDNGFGRAYLQASALKMLNEVLSDEFFAPILELKNKKSGFLTDEKKETGPYKAEIVKECIIEALLFGLSPYGNRFNILAGKMYPTREGYRAKLRAIGAKYKLYPSLPKKIEGEGVSVTYKLVEWEYQGKKGSEKNVEFPIRVNKGMGDDAIMGKAERKILKYIYTEITNEDYGEGEVQDATYELIQPENETEKTVKKEEEAAVEIPVADPIKQKNGNLYLDKAKDLADLEKKILECRKVPNFDETHYNELKAKMQKDSE